MLNRFRIGVPLTLGLMVGLSAQSAKPPTSASLIAGRVVDAGTGSPIDEAVVMLNTVSGRVDDRQAVMVDAQGRFVFRDVPKGSFSLTANATGFVSGGYGEPWPPAGLLVAPNNAAQKRLEVGEGEHITDLTIKLWKFASLSGRVLDQAGQPIVGVTVRALSRIVVAGRPTLTFDSWDCGGSCLTARTDDRGVFRFGRLAPGEFVVAVPSVVISSPTSLQRLSFSGPFVAQMPAAFNESTVGGMEWLGGGGTMMGAFLRGPNDRIAIADVDRTLPIAALLEDGRIFTYPTQFYPSTTRLADVAMIRLASGETRSDINFTLRPAKTVTVSGIISGSDGPVSDYLLRLVPADQDLLLSDPEVAQSVSDTDGSFMFVGVTPGDYSVRVLRVSPRPGANAAPNQARGQWADSKISVGDTDVRGVSVTLHELPRVSGRIEFDGTAPKPARAPTPTIERTDGRRPGRFGMFLTRTDQQNQFTTEGQLPGSYLVQTYALEGWYFRSAMLNGRDVSDVPFDVADADVTGIVVTFSDKPATIVSGTVSDRNGVALASAVVVAFPADPKRWSGNGWSSRRFAAAISTRTGTFSMVNLPSGDYVIAALHDIEPLRWQDPAVLTKLAVSGSKISLVASGTTNVRLQPIRWPR